MTFVQDYWADTFQQGYQWTAPLKPTAEDVELFRNQLQDSSRTLLLGATKELQHLASVAVDQHPFPNVVVANWTNLPFEDEFEAVIGDGSLNAFQETPELFFCESNKALKKNGRLILRVYIRPEVTENLETVLENKENLSFHAFKWKVAHALANPYVPVKAIYEMMKQVTDHPMLSLYKDSDLIYYFPKLSELPPFHHIQYPSTYELSNRCPVITWHKG